MTLAIEPMTSMGAWQVKILPDGWTAVTQDGSWRRILNTPWR